MKPITIKLFVFITITIVTALTGCGNKAVVDTNDYLELTSIDAFLEVLDENPNGVLANRNGEQLRTQIISFQFIEGNRVYFCTGSEKPLYEQLLSFPYVSYCTYPEDFEPVLSLNGKVVFSDDAALKSRAFNGTGYASGFVRNHYKSLDNPNLKLFYIDVEEVETYDSDGAKMYRLTK